jgi:predicted nucleic acid-binding protein
VQAELAATLKHKYQIRYADSFAAALALTHKARLVTSDPEFDKLGRQMKIPRLPRHTS